MFVPLAAALSAVVTAWPGLAAEATQKGTPMSYGEVRAFLAKHTELVELTNPEGARVAVCPAWQGRVMTSTTGGMDGPSFGFVNEEFIREGRPNLHFANYGGEERMWLSPEGGQFSLWFKPGVPQTLADWYTPPAFNEGAWKIVSGPNEPLAMAATMKLQNASATEFHLDVRREVRLLGNSDLVRLLGPQAAAIIAHKGAKLVAYETSNRLTNRGGPMTRAGGLVSIWILGMLNCGPQCAVVVPYKDGDASRLGPPVKSDYFGPVPPERLKVLPGAKPGEPASVLLFRADGNYRAKIGISQRRARNVLGSIDFQLGVLTLVQFSMPQDPTRELYMNNAWGGPHAEPYTGDVVNSYNDGPPAPGKKGLGPFYEVESLSPTRELATGESLVHCHRTIHVQADAATLDQLARQVLGVGLDTVRREMLGQ
jgi:hypothetical protein